MTRLPSLFISHGSPMLALTDSPAQRFLRELGQRYAPKAILVASAHWETNGGPALSQVDRPDTMHDFGGFPHALYEIRYPAPGAPDTALQAATLLADEGFAVKTSTLRGLDHGAWVPLSLMYPKADIPVAQISIVRAASPAAHLRIGQTLSRLRDQGVLVIGSGSLTHNLYEFRGHDMAAPVPDWVSDFDEWMHRRLEQHDIEALLNYRQQAPNAVRNHPTEEHLLPLFVALGAAGTSAAAQRLHASYEYGVLSMDAYAFE